MKIANTFEYLTQKLLRMKKNKRNKISFRCGQLIDPPHDWYLKHDNYVIPDLKNVIFEICKKIPYKTDPVIQGTFIIKKNEKCVLLKL